MATKKVVGSQDHVETSVSEENSDRNAKIVEVEGLYSHLRSNRESIISEVKGAFTVESSTLSSTGDGMGKLTVRLVRYVSDQSFSASRTTFRVDMQDVNYDLEDHPHLKEGSGEDGRSTILKWLATDENKRSDSGKFYFMNSAGTLVEIKQDTYPLALKFCSAYMSGIRNFKRYYPVVERISTYKNPPGLIMSERSYTGGSPDFSECGSYDDPPISLSGYGNGHWFKSKDSWTENADKTWNRTEQWTYTPESSSGEHSWIYNELP